VNAGRLDPEFDPRLVEAAVLEALRGHAGERDFHAEREVLYDIVEPEPREAAFEALHARWFGRLALDRAFHRALAEHPEIAARCRRCLVARARGRREEVADLLVAPDERPTLVVLVTPGTVAVPERLHVFLRRELLRVGDMLDPGFGYDPAPPAGVAGGAWERPVRDAYRVLWDAYVDGRLVRRGVLPATARRDRLGDSSVRSATSAPMPRRRSSGSSAGSASRTPSSWPSPRADRTAGSRGLGGRRPAPSNPARRSRILAYHRVSESSGEG